MHISYILVSVFDALRLVSQGFFISTVTVICLYIMCIYII